MGLPKIFAGRVTVIEGYDEKLDVYTIHVSIFNDFIGRMMQYAGTFLPSAR